MSAVLDQILARWRASAPGQWFYAREPRERTVVAWLAAAIGLTLVWLAVWQPIAQWQAAAYNRYENAQTNLSWLQANEQKARSAATSQTDGTDRSVLRLVTQAANARGLTLNRVQPEGEGAVSVVMQDQPFNDVLSFVAQLAENNGVQAARASFDGSGTAGRVNVQIKFQ